MEQPVRASRFVPGMAVKLWRATVRCKVQYWQRIGFYAATPGRIVLNLLTRFPGHLSPALEFDKFIFYDS